MAKKQKNDLYSEIWPCFCKVPKDFWIIKIPKYASEIKSKRKTRKDVLETVAKAIFLARFGEGNAWERGYELMKEEHLKIARSALYALAELYYRGMYDEICDKIK